MKKKTQKSTRKIKTTRPKAGQDTSTAKSIAHYNGILIEELNSKFKFVVEHVTGVEARLMGRMDEKFSEIDDNFDQVRKVLGYHSQLLEKHGQILDHHSQVLEKHSQILDHHGQVLDDHTESFRKNELAHREIMAKLDRVADKIEEHDIILQKLTA